jgi:RNA polymerase sigma-70 factor (ECF subfamily)
MVALASSVLESAALIRHVAEEHAEFTALVERNSLFLFRVANSVLRSREEAEDAVQESFLKLYRTDAWRKMEDEKAFLARVVWREAIDRLPKRGQESIDEEHHSLASRETSPESNALRSNESALLRSLIDALHEELRQPLLLSAFEELNSRQIGLVMGIPEGTVRTRLQRARSELKRQFEMRRHCDTQKGTLQ